MTHEHFKHIQVSERLTSRYIIHVNTIPTTSRVKGLYTEKMGEHVKKMKEKKYTNTYL